ncbi:MAG: LPD23 domain-containing protein [Pseudomonadota bacterium]
MMEAILPELAQIPDAGEDPRVPTRPEDRSLYEMLRGAARRATPPALRPVPGQIADLFALLSPGADMRDAYLASGRLMRSRSAYDAARNAAEMTSSLAGLFMPGTAVGVSEVVSPAIFAGVRAVNADRAALEAAQRMARKGASRDEIWKRTGWFRGADGNWRFEIDDSAAKLRPGPVRDVAERSESTRPLADFLDHPGLVAAHGESEDLANMPVSLRPSAQMDLYYRDEPGVPSEWVELSGADTEEARKGLLHELQHAVQAREGFAPGGNVELGSGAMVYDGRAAAAIEKEIGMVEEILERRAGDLPTDEMGSLVNRREALLHRLHTNATLQGYRRTAGEVEARNVEARRDMTGPQRRATPPWKTQDVRDEEQIVTPPERLSGRSRGR